MPALPHNQGSSKVQNLINATVTANTASDAVSGCDHFTAMILHIDLSAIGGTSPTFDVYLQQLSADGSTYYDMAHFPQIVANGQYYLGLVSGGNLLFSGAAASLAANTIRTVPFGGTQKISIVKGGTNPTAVIKVHAEYVE